MINAVSLCALGEIAGNSAQQMRAMKEDICGNGQLVPGAGIEPARRFLSEGF